MTQPNNGNNGITTVPATAMTDPPNMVIERKPPVQAQAMAIQELENSFDPDLRQSIRQRLAAFNEQILAIAQDEEELQRAMELSMLHALHKAKEKGKQMGRKDFAQFLKKENEADKKKFIREDLPEIVKACSFMDDTALKATVEKFAARLNIELKWETTSAGLKCSAI